MEIKTRRDARSLNQGIQQLVEYMGTMDFSLGWLALFDRRKRTSWENKLFWKEIIVGEGMVIVAECCCCKGFATTTVNR